MTLLGILQCCFISTFCNTCRQCCNRDTTTIQYFQCLTETIAYFTQSLAIRNSAIVENHFSCFTSTHAQLILFLTASETWCTTLYNKCSCIATGSGFARSTHHHSHITTFSMRNPVLGTIDDPMITITHRSCFHIARITTSIGLC